MIRKTLFISLFAAGHALAGGHATLQFTADNQPNTDMSLSWQDGDTVRMDLEEQASYMLVKDGKAYSVTHSGGAPQVMDMAALGQFAGASQQSSPTVAQAQTVTKWQATGKAETVAGIEGEIYQITWTDENGKTDTDEAVLSDNPQAAEMSKAFYGFASAMANAVDEQSTDALNQELVDKKLGVLRFGDQFRVTQLSGDTPAADQFELPAKPQDLGGAMQRMRDAFKTQ